MSDKKIDYEEITKLVSFLEEKHLTHFELEVEGFKIKISRALSAPPSPAKISTPASPSVEEAANSIIPSGPVVSEERNHFHFITSPMVGTFYRASDPTSPPFVEIGEEVKKSQTLCIIEAMKLMNEIESDVDGIVAEIYVENGKPVEYGQRLFAVQPLAG
ncbi:MAG: acetyl-CoA carboxylase biotin carboxyl carrier protein [Candidatus Aminicenantales bacterium]